MRVVELGSGIGRFTADLAKTAKKVHAYDFMDTLTEANRTRNGHLPNVEITQQDVTSMEMAPGSCDVVFSNWLLMYLSDGEVGSLARKALSWVSIDDFSLACQLVVIGYSAFCCGCHNTFAGYPEFNRMT